MVGVEVRIVIDELSARVYAEIGHIDGFVRPGALTAIVEALAAVDARLSALERKQVPDGLQRHPTVDLEETVLAEFDVAPMRTWRALFSAEPRDGVDVVNASDRRIRVRILAAE